MQIKDIMTWGRRDMAGSAEDNPIGWLQHEMNHVFDKFWKNLDPQGSRFGSSARPGTPPVDLVETDSSVEVTIELPGMDRDDFEVLVTDEDVTVKGEKKSGREDRSTGYRLSERAFGSIYRRVPLPAGVVSEDTRAELKNGVLMVSIPRTSGGKAKAKKIQVTTN